MLSQHADSFLWGTPVALYIRTMRCDSHAEGCKVWSSKSPHPSTGCAVHSVKSCRNNSSFSVYIWIQRDRQKWSLAPMHGKIREKRGATVTRIIKKHCRCCVVFGFTLPPRSWLLILYSVLHQVLCRDRFVTISELALWGGVECGHRRSRVEKTMPDVEKGKEGKEVIASMITCHVQRQKELSWPN